jgi:hypothetical protein
MKWMWRLRIFVRTYRPRRRLSAILTGRRGRMSDVRAALAPVMVERGVNPSVAVIAFTGGAEKLMMPVYEFFDVTKALGYSRILLCDQYHRRYHNGIDSERPDFPSLIGYLKEEIARLRPEQVICIGTSSGGYAAIRAGYELGADYVHAFAPQTGKRPPGERSAWWLRSIKSRAAFEFIDLAQLLGQPNGRTVYYVHYGRGCVRDRYYAERLFTSPFVASIGYPSDTHLIAVFLAKRGFLGKALVIDNQERIIEIAREHFRESLEIHGSLEGRFAAAAV